MTDTPQENLKFPDGKSTELSQEHKEKINGLLAELKKQKNDTPQENDTHSCSGIIDENGICSKCGMSIKQENKADEIDEFSIILNKLVCLYANNPKKKMVYINESRQELARVIENFEVEQTDVFIPNSHYDYFKGATIMRDKIADKVSGQNLK